MDKFGGLDILTFHPAHAEVAELTDHEEKIFKRMPDAYAKLQELSSRSTEAVTIMLEGRIIFMGGFIKMWPGVCEAWMIPTKHFAKHKGIAFKGILHFIEIFADSMKIHRMQAICFGDELHSNFLDHLGFKFEGTLKNYSDEKEDHYIYGRVF